MLNPTLAPHGFLFAEVEFSHDLVQLVHFLDYFARRVRLEFEEIETGRADEAAL